MQPKLKAMWHTVTLFFVNIENYGDIDTGIIIIKYNIFD